MSSFTFTEELLESLVGGTLVEYLDGQGRSAEFDRGIISESAFDRAGFQGRGAITIRTDKKCHFSGSLELVEQRKREGDVYYFYARVMDVYYAFAPPGVEIPQV